MSEAEAVESVEPVESVDDNITIDGPTEEVVEETEQAEPVAEQETTEAKTEPKKVEFSDEQQEFINNNIISKQVGRRKEAESKAERLERENTELKSKLPQDQRPEVNALPDYGDPDYDAKLQARDESIKQQGQWDYEERRRSDNELRQHQENQRQQSKQASETLENFGKNADDAGITVETLRGNFQTLADFDSPDSVVAYLLDEPTGPQIVNFLARNPQEIDALKGLSPMQVAARIATEVKPKALSATKRPNVAPAPSEILTGKGAQEGEGGLAGAVYE